MENIVLLLVLLVIVIIGLPIAAIVTAMSRTSQLRSELEELTHRLRSLEMSVGGLINRQGASTEQAPAAPVPAFQARPQEAPSEEAAPEEEEPVSVQPPPALAYFEQPAEAEPESAQAPPPVAVAFPLVDATPSFQSLDSGRSDDARTLESRIGSQWFNRIGILAMLIGVAWFLKMAFDNHWIGPLGRVLIGLLAGAALIAWSERFHRRGFAIFSYSLKAIGSGTLYLSLWAAFQLYGLMPAGAAFAAMIAVTAFNAYMAWIQNAELLALYAIAGGLSTPLLVSTGGNHEVTLFTYLLILDLAAFVLVVLKPWSRLLFGAYTGTVAFFFAWWSVYYSPAETWTTAFFLCCFFIPFALAPRLVKLSGEEGDAFQGWDGLVVYALPVANAVLGFLGFYSVLTPSASEWAGPWLAVAFAAFYLFTMRLPARGVLRESTAPLSALNLAAAVVFLTIAIPLKTRGGWMTIGWLVEGAALLWLSRRTQSMLLRFFALLSSCLGLVALLTMNTPVSTRPILNERFGTYCVAIAVFAFVAWLASNSKEKEGADSLIVWPFLAPAAALTVNALILIAFSWEIHSYWWLSRWQPLTGSWRDYWMYAEFSYSALFMLFGGALLTLGFMKQSPFLRWQALILFAVTIVKVFLVDMSQLSSGLRVLSFIGLGFLLLCVSYVYQRDLLNLRGQKEQNS
jgi:uncharacterized membrane protein